MHRRYIWSLLLICHIVAAQTAGYVSIPGTKYSMIPPSGFELAENFSGFYNNDTGASIMVNELRSPYKPMAEGFTREFLQAKGMTLVNKKPIVFNGSEAFLIEIVQSINEVLYNKQLLMFGDASKTVLVNGIYSDESDTDVAAVKESVLSIRFNAEQNDNPLDAANFTLETEGTDFKILKYSVGALMYSTDDKLPTTKPTFTASGSLVKIAASYREQLCMDLMQRLPGGKPYDIESNEEITIDGLTGYEIVAYGEDMEGLRRLFYHVILFNDTEDYYRFAGKAAEDLQKNLNAYKKIVRTFRRK